MNELVPWIVLAVLLCLLGFVIDARKKSARELVRRLREAEIWASRFYADAPTRSVAANFVALLERQIYVPCDRFQPSTRFLEDLKMDDLEPFEVLIGIEQTFKTGRIPHADAEQMRTIDDVVQYLSKKKAAEPGATDNPVCAP